MGLGDVDVDACGFEAYDLELVADGGLDLDDLMLVVGGEDDAGLVGHDKGVFYETCFRVGVGFAVVGVLGAAFVDGWLIRRRGF